MSTGLHRAAVADSLASLQAAAGATANGTALDVKGWDGVLFQVTGATPVGTITFEGSADDGTTWVSIEAYNIADGTVATTTTAVGDFVATCAGLSNVRARLTFTSGTWTVGARAFPGAAAAALVGSSATSGGTSNVNVAKVNGVTPLMGAGNTGTGSPRVTIATDQVAVPVDTELPAAAALTDTDSNPTSPTVGAALMGYEEVGAKFHRLRTGRVSFSVLDNRDCQVALTYATTAGGNGASPVSNPADSLATTKALAAGNMKYNGASLDMARNNTDVTVFSSSARTGTPTPFDGTNYDGRGLHLVIDCTAVSGSSSVVFTIQGKDAVSAKFYTILASAAIVGTGTTVLRVYPGLTASGNLVVSDILPRTWRVIATHGTADSTTYSVGASVIQ